MLLSGASGEARSLIDATIRGNAAIFSSAVDCFYASLCGPRTGRRSDSRPRASRNPPHYRGRYAGRGIRASTYKQAPDLFAKNNRVLAERILSGKPLLGEETYPTTNSVEALYAAIWESPSSPDDDLLDSRPITTNTFRSITQEDIKLAMKGWKPSAPGSDGLTVQAIMRLPLVTIDTLFNCVLYRGHLPSPWNTMRTTLIPKAGDQEDASNWRPITISSALRRLFHSPRQMSRGGYLSKPYPKRIRKN